ncbi:MAG TPA: hypothetical protein VF062_09695 [Candidatus Limnocylindrales bacterium]
MTDSATPPPQDTTVDRRWFLSRMAGVWAAAAGAGALASATFAGPAQANGSGVWETAYARTIRPEALADPTELTISEAAAAFRRKLLKPVDLVEAYLDRITRYEDIYQAYLWRTPPADLLDAAHKLKSAAGVPRWPASLPRRRTTSTPKAFPRRRCHPCTRASYPHMTPLCTLA